MSELKTILQGLSVKADLNKIIKYHPASTVYLNDSSLLEYNSIFEVKLLGTEINKEFIPNSDYRYSEIVDLCLPDPLHENNLLVLVKNMIEIDWSFYMSQFLLDQNGNLLLNLYDEIKATLEELKVLTLINESGNFQQVETKLKLRETLSIDKDTTRRTMLRECKLNWLTLMKIEKLQNCSFVIEFKPFVSLTIKHTHYTMSKS